MVEGQEFLETEQFCFDNSDFFFLRCLFKSPKFLFQQAAFPVKKFKPNIYLLNNTIHNSNAIYRTFLCFKN